eukprot:150640-Pelagomonas_calceolata.AAC.4
MSHTQSKGGPATAIPPRESACIAPPRAAASAPAVTNWDGVVNSVYSRLPPRTWFWRCSAEVWSQTHRFQQNNSSAVSCKSLSTSMRQLLEHHGQLSAHSIASITVAEVTVLAGFLEIDGSTTAARDSPVAVVNPDSLAESFSDAVQVSFSAQVQRQEELYQSFTLVLSHATTKLVWLKQLINQCFGIAKRMVSVADGIGSTVRSAGQGLFQTFLYNGSYMMIATVG